MTLNQLKYFSTACKFNSLSKAAIECNISQPAISIAIKELETEFDLILFKRNNNRLNLTEDGILFLKEANKLLKQIDLFSRNMKDKGNKKSYISIGVPPLIGTFVFPKIVNSYMKIHPECQLSITETGSLKVLNLIELDQIDLGLASYSEENNDKFEYVELLTTEFVFAVNKNHHLATKQIIDFNELDNEQIILYAKGSFQNRCIMEEIEKNKIEPIVFLHSSQLSTILEFLKNQNVGAFLHKEIVESNPNLVGLHFTKPIKIKIGLVYNKNSNLTTAAKQFIEFCKNYKRS